MMMLTTALAGTAGGDRSADESAVGCVARGHRFRVDCGGDRAAARHAASSALCAGFF
jgi:hypothetical protein